MSNHDQSDKELNDYLKGDSNLSAHYKKIDKSQPPGHLDDAIMAAAKRQAGSKPKRASGPFSNNFMIPFATAATLLITVGIINIMPEKEFITPLSTKSEPESIAESEKMAKLRETLKTHKKELKEKMDLQRKNRPIYENREIFKSKDSAAKQLMSEEMQAPLASLPLENMSTSPRKKSLAPEFSDQEQTPENSLPAKQKIKQAEMEVDTMVDTMADTIGETKKNIITKQALLTNKPDPTSTAVQPATPQPNMPQSMTQGSFTDSVSQTGVNTNKRFLASSAETASDDTAQDTNIISELIYNEKKWENISPKEWLKRIKKLRELKRNEEADKILELFKKKFPDYSLD